jgi:formylglycine-generating enzyme required for sulfatase activity
MGAPAKADERPVHTVTLAAPFWMQTTEVTQGQWKAVMGTSPWSNAPDVRNGDNYPAVLITWPQAQQFINKLNELDPGHGYRLPSEAEWEYSCRAGAQGIYSFGSDRKRLPDFAWFDENASHVGENYAHPVAQKGPNAWGLYDMHGNVWEWCQDSYHDSYQGAPTNGAPWSSTEFDSHVYRGGGFRNAERFTHCSARAGLDDEDQSDNVGFRVVMQRASTNVVTARNSGLPRVHAGRRCFNVRLSRLEPDVEAMSRVLSAGLRAPLAFEPSDGASLPRVARGAPHR